MLKYMEREYTNEDFFEEAYRGLENESVNEENRRLEDNQNNR